MAASVLIQSLDSLWFFGTVLSGGQVVMGVATDQDKPTEAEPGVNVEAKLETSGRKLCPECSGREGLAAAEEKEGEKRSPSGEVRKKKKKKKKIRSKRCPFDWQRRKVLGELDLGCFDGGRRDRQLWLVVDEMPPLSDGIAMKEHLKCWAYAVACTVK
ncbi:hypothetical protein CDL15_Pgr001087 [Punica granatum]|uniref:Uncharacterized protein n=1 Tax=Punica granatum TaxID=22663 RepID=A0A218WK73_PUNGR|nr:hypothetical protein CDL15_Pgr001087 [Punica granatum]PKI50601.1 hypothetical protein CRG98_028988 [Punica granatum]